MSKNKGQNNSNNMRTTGASADMTDRSSAQPQNKSNMKKSPNNKTKTSGTQG